MEVGKKICETLRAVRRRIAVENGISYTPTQCNHEGPCSGTCPACERERLYIEEQLWLKHTAGKALKVVGVAAGMAALSPCQEAKAQEQDSVVAEVQVPQFKWEAHIFDFGQCRSEYLEQIDEMAAFIKEFPDRKFLVGGHTDERGSAKYNKKLSQTRADYLRSQLIERGVSPDQLVAKGFSFERPNFPNAQTEPEHEMNRRVSLEFLEPEKGEK